MESDNILEVVSTLLLSLDTTTSLSLAWSLPTVADCIKCSTSANDVNFNREEVAPARAFVRNTLIPPMVSITRLGRLTSGRAFGTRISCRVVVHQPPSYRTNSIS